MLTSVHGSSFLVEAAAKMTADGTRMYNRKQGFSYVARMPQSVEPWTNGGLCEVNSPPTAIFRYRTLQSLYRFSPRTSGWASVDDTVYRTYKTVDRIVLFAVRLTAKWKR